METRRFKEKEEEEEEEEKEERKETEEWEELIKRGGREKVEGLQRKGKDRKREIHGNYSQSFYLPRI